MKIMILGGDGYLGWPTAMHFAAAGHDVTVVDSGVKRQWEQKIGGGPLWHVPHLRHRVRVFNGLGLGHDMKAYIGDIGNWSFLSKVFEEVRPAAIVHYAEQPSAPYSMKGVDEAIETQLNNVAGTLAVIHAMRKYAPDAHLVKLGTMGEYGTPNIRIEEGWLTLTHEGREDRVLYPKKPGSFYHLSKVHDSANLEFACRMWDLRVTDLNQGVVYGTGTRQTNQHEDLTTSFHYDDVFGTVLNRFVVQAVANMPLTIYGKGGQTRGYLNIADTLQCVELAVMNPAKKGEFRVFNQFTEVFSVRDLAEKVHRVGRSLGYKVEVANLENPRIELEDHFYDAVHTGLPALGLKPHILDDTVISGMFERVGRARKHIDPSIIMPTVTWKDEEAQVLPWPQRAAS